MRYFSFFLLCLSATLLLLLLLVSSLSGFSPLEGFMDQEDYDAVVADMRTKVGGGEGWADGGLGFRGC